MNRDTKEAINLIKTRGGYYDYFTQYDPVYAFTNENIGEYMPNLTGKSVLTVASSGDHYFQAVYNGAKEVDCFDINRLTIYYLRLKKAAIESFDIEHFHAFFDNNSTFAFNYYDFLQVCERLDNKTMQFFKAIYDDIAKRKQACNGKFLYEGLCFLDNLQYQDIYLKESKYTKLQSKLKLIKKVNFIPADISELKKAIRKKYDTIFLSNISYYQNPEKYYDQIVKLESLLKKYGQIYFAYIYSYIYDIEDEYIDLLDENRNCSSIIVDSVPMEGTINGAEEKDMVLIYNKGKVK